MALPTPDPTAPAAGGHASSEEPMMGPFRAPRASPQESPTGLRGQRPYPCGRPHPRSAGRRRTPATSKRPRGSAIVLVAALAAVAAVSITLGLPAPAVAGRASRPVCTRARVIPAMRAARLPGERFDFRSSPLLCAGRWAFMEPHVNNDFDLHMYARWRARTWHNVSIAVACRPPSPLPHRLAFTCQSN
jgi:hypothetical protein